MLVGESLNLELVMFLRSHRLSMKVSKIIWKKLLLKMERIAYKYEQRNLLIGFTQKEVK